MVSQPLKVVQNSEKQMPCNIEAEQALIGSILVSNEIYDEISSIVDSRKFVDPITTSYPEKSLICSSGRRAFGNMDFNLSLIEFS